MWTVSILCDNFESLNCIGVADYVVQHLGSVFFDPTMQHELKKMELNRKAPNQGNSYGASTDPLGAVDLAEDDMWSKCGGQKDATRHSVTDAFLVEFTIDLLAK